MDASFLAAKFAAALPYDRYVQTGNPEQQRRWRQVYEAARLTPAQTQLLGSFRRDMKLLIVSGVWCGDCVQQVPLLQRVAEANPARVELRLVDRDVHADLSGQLHLNAGARVPTVLFLAEDFELCGLYGDRSLSRYRAMAAQRMGGACPLGAAPQPQEELAATLQDWVDEVERVQLMLMLSARLIEKHGE
jgi:thioredoxin-like negative regulator of GroEL